MSLGNIGSQLGTWLGQLLTSDKAVQSLQQLEGPGSVTSKALAQISPERAEPSSAASMTDLYGDRFEMAVPHGLVSSISPEVRAAIATFLEDQRSIWNTDRSKWQPTFERWFNRNPDELARNLTAIPFLMAYFVVLEMAAWNLGRHDRLVLNDEKMHRFTASVNELTRRLVGLTGATHFVDDATMRQLVDAQVAKIETGRIIFVASSHGSYFDIPYLLSFVPSRRFLAKPLSIVPNEVMRDLGQTTIYRPNAKLKEKAPEKYQEQQDEAYRQTEAGMAQRRADQAMFDYFPAGTRSKVGGINPVKDGLSFDALKQNGLVLVDVSFGVSQIVPQSFPLVPHRLITEGVGLNYYTFYKAKLLDPAKMPELLAPNLDDKARAKILSQKIQTMQIEMHLACVEELNSMAIAGDKKAQQQLDEFFVQYKSGFELLAKNDKKMLSSWCAKNKVSEGYVEALHDFFLKPVGKIKFWGPMQVLYGAGTPAINDFRHSNIFRWAKGQLISQASTIGNWFGGLLNRNWFSKIPTANIEIQPETDFPDTFEQAEAGYREENREALTKGQVLADSQWDLQSLDFQAERDTFASHNRAAIADYRMAARELHEVYQASVKPEFEPVSHTSDFLDRTLLASDHFNDVDSDLRRWFYHTHLAYQYWQEQAAVGNTKKATRIQKHYYGLLTRGIRLRMNNEVNRMLGHELGTMYSLKQYALLAVQYPKIKDLAQRMAQIELIGYVLGRGLTLVQAREKLETSVAVISDTIANEESKGKAKKIGYSKKEMEAKIAMIKVLEAAYPGQALQAVLTKISGSFYVDVESTSLVTQLDADADLKQARNGYVAAKKQWLSDSREHYVATMPARTRLVTETLIAELKVNDVDHDLQVSRYRDLWAKLDLKSLGARTESLTQGFEKALAEYEEAYKNYHAYTKKILNHEGKEYERSKLEGATFIKLLNLHWATQDAYRYAKRPEAEKLRVLSAMFPNQTEALANRSQGSMTAMKGILQALPFDLVIDLYMHIFVFKTDPRHIQSYMSRWGHGALARRAEKVFIHGGRELAGYVGQFTGTKAVEEGVSFLTAEQKEMGMNPHAVQFDNIHESFGDYELMVGLFAGLGLGSPNIVFEKLNFGPKMPVLGWVLNEGDGIENMRGVKNGMPELQDRIDEAVDHGVSASGFGWGSRPYTAALSPLAGEGEDAFYARREFVTKYNYGEMGKAARDAETPLVPTTHMLGDGQVPDFPLSGNGDNRSLAMGSPEHVQASIGFGRPIAAEIFGDDEETLDAFGHGIHEADIERQMVRYRAKGQTPDLARARMSAQSIGSAHALAVATESGRYLGMAGRFGTVRPGSRAIGRPTVTQIYRR